MTSMKAEIAKAKKLNRAMISYAMKTRQHLDVPFAEALRQMQIQADRVAADLECSESFVVAWTKAELSKVR